MVAKIFVPRKANNTKKNIVDFWNEECEFHEIDGKPVTQSQVTDIIAQDWVDDVHAMREKLIDSAEEDQNDARTDLVSTYLYKIGRNDLAKQLNTRWDR